MIGQVRPVSDGRQGRADRGEIGVELGVVVDAELTADFLVGLLAQSDFLGLGKEAEFLSSGDRIDGAGGQKKDEGRATKNLKTGSLRAVISF
jgi:hypothetical protein